MSSCSWFPMNQRQIRDWLAKHPEALPRTLADLERFPMAFRRVMINVVTPETRLALWREHLEGFLKTDSTLTEPQRQIVKETIPQLPELFAAPAPNPTIRAWEQSTSTVFTREEAGRVFMTLGAPEPPEGIPLPPDALPTPAV